MDFLLGWAGLILGFSGLIFIHELGHFLLAKWNGVRVYVFSLGMGPYLLSFTWRETVYALSLIPVGGYVKLMGQDDMNAVVAPTKDKSDYRNKRPGQKAAILAAGAIFNLVFSVVAFTVCYRLGMWVDEPRMGTILSDKPLASAMLHPPSDGKPADLKRGDRIIEVNGSQVKTSLEATLFIAGSPQNEDLYLKVDRHVAPVVVRPEHNKKLGASVIGLSPYIEDVAVPLGFSTADRVIVAADIQKEKKLKDLPAARAGMRQGDEILRIEDPDSPDAGVDITELKQMSNAGPASKGNLRRFVLSRNGDPVKLDIQAEKNEETGSLSFGILTGLKRRVTRIDPASEAHKAGLREGNYVIGFNPDNPNTLPWRTGTIIWKKTWETKDEDAIKSPVTVPDSADMFFTESYHPRGWLKYDTLGAALGTAWDDTVRYSGMVFTILRGLFSGNIGTQALSGPVGIGQGIHSVAASSDSFLNYLWFMAFLSLNLGVFQFIPIPLLDGWHLVMVAVEKMKGSPVAPKVQEAFQYVGLFIVGSLMLLATYNDIRRILFG